MDIFFLLLIVYGVHVILSSTYVSIKEHKTEAFVKSLNTFGFSIFMIYVMFTSTVSLKFGIAVTIGMSLSAVGDYILAKRKEIEISNPSKATIMFAAGMGAFLLGYLTYGITFLTKGGLAVTRYEQVILLILFAILTLSIFLALDMEKVGILKPIVYVYFCQAFVLGISGIQYLFNVHSIESAFIFWGAILLFASDSLIGVNMFKKPLKRAELLIMVTYTIGQLFITLGVTLALRSI